MSARFTRLDTANEAEVDAAFQVATDMEIAADGWSDIERAHFDAIVTSVDALPDAHRLAWVDGKVVGALVVESDRTAHDVYLDAAIDPDADQSILDALIAEGLEAAAQEARAIPLPPSTSDPFQPTVDRWQIGAATIRGDQILSPALEAAGFRKIREFYKMHLDLPPDFRIEPQAPAGATVAPVKRPEDREILGTLMRASFADHFGATSDYDTEEWLAAVGSRPGSTPDRWWIARLEGKPVGYCMTDGTRAERNEGHVMNLGVLPSARGRGVGRWLLQLAIADTQASGNASISLSVDSDNTTPALSLYESVGMTTKRIIDFWSRPAPEAMVLS